MMDSYARIKNEGVNPFIDNIDNADDGILKLALRRSDIQLAKNLRKDVTMAHLPMGRYLTTEGHEYYFNSEGAILFAGDPAQGILLPTTRYMNVPNMDPDKTLFYYRYPSHLIMKTNVQIGQQISGTKISVQHLAQKYVDAYRKYTLPADGVITDELGDTMIGRPKDNLIDRIVHHNLPRGCYVTVEGHEYYFNHVGAVILGWNPKEQALIPTHHQVKVVAVRIDIIHRYGRVPDAALYSIVSVTDDIYRRAVLNMRIK